MTDFYKKKELAFSILIIVIYSLLNSVATYLNNMINTDSMLFQMIFNIILAILLYVFIIKNNLKEKYGLNKVRIPLKRVLFFIPAIILVTGNLWFGIKMNMTIPNTIVYLIFMLFVGICEELIFRGFLYKAIEKDNKVEAIIITSLTFGIGHLLHLFDANGVELFSNIMQVLGAISYGFLFVSLFINTKSLIPAIIMHSAIDMLSAFSNSDAITPTVHIIYLAFSTIVCALYSLYLFKSNKTEKVKF